MRKLFFSFALLTLCCWSTAAVAQDADCAELCQCCECDEGDVECLEDCDCAQDCECADFVEAQEEEYFEQPTSVVYVSYWPTAFLGAYIYYNSVPYFWYGGYYHRYHTYYYGGHSYWVHHRYWRHHRPHHGHAHPGQWNGGHPHGKAHAKHKTQVQSAKGKGQSWNHKAKGKSAKGKVKSSKHRAQTPNHKVKAQVKSPPHQSLHSGTGQAKSKVKSPKQKGKQQAPGVHAGEHKRVAPRQGEAYHAASYKQKAAARPAYRGASKPGASRFVPASGKRGSKPAYRASSRGGGSRPANRSGGRGRGRGRR